MNTNTQMITSRTMWLIYKRKSLDYRSIWVHLCFCSKTLATAGWKPSGHIEAVDNVSVPTSLCSHLFTALKGIMRGWVITPALPTPYTSRTTHLLCAQEGNRLIRECGGSFTHLVKYIYKRRSSKTLSHIFLQRPDGISFCKLNQY